MIARGGTMIEGDDQNERDAGFTLIEIIISLVLSAIIAGVTVAAMLTSMNVIDVTTEQISGSTDTGLIASWFYRDAQAAGGTLPSTGQPDPAAGVSVTNSPAGWQGCAQAGALVVRFSWVERVSAGQDRDVVVSYGLSGTRLTRRLCDGAGTSNLVVGENVAAATATCHPDASCAGTPDRVSLHITGTGERVPADHTFSASLRELAGATPSSANTVAAPLVVLGGGGSTPCPPLFMAGTGNVAVLGDAVVAAGCGSSLVGGNASRLRPTGVTSGITDVADPLASLVAPTADCGTGGANPDPLGVSASPTSVIVHPQPVVVSGALLLQPGRYVFCQGLTIAAGAVVQGTGVTVIIPSGGLQIDAGARLDVTAPTSGTFANVLVWSMSPSSLTMTFDPAANVLRGLVYAPDAPVTITARSPVAIGGVVARSVRFEGDTAARIGLPIPAVGLAPQSMPPAIVGAPYGPFTLTGSGGTAPYQFAASGLPPGMTLAPNGQLSGAPSATGSFDALVTVTDDTGAAGTVAVQLTVGSPVGIAGPATLPDGQLGTAYPTTTMAASGGTNPLSWSASGLPAGLTMSTGGVLSGTPTAPGPSSVVVTLTDALGATAAANYTLTVGAPLIVSGPQALFPGQEGLPYSSTTMAASGGAPPYVWSATGLPPGLTMSFGGLIAGTPTTAGSYSVVAYTSDSAGTFAVHSYAVTISPAAPPAPPTCPTSPVGWRAEYYANVDLSGSPVLCRDDPSIAFNWNGAAPGAGVPGTDFSVRWSRTLDLNAGSYEFVMGSDDGARLFVDGALVADDWVYRPYASRVITQVLGTGPHNLVMEYFQGPGQSSATLDWSLVVPAACPATVNGWMGEYFRNRTLTGPASLCRDDAAIDFDWAQGTPGAPITNDDFSVRWTRTQVFTAGSYAFQVGSDDGARLYVDGVLVGDWWYDTSYVTRTVNRTLAAGSHVIVMEFYERGGQAHATLTW